jgi:hypothetical protein
MFPENGRLEEASPQGDRDVGHGLPGGLSTEELRHLGSVYVLRRPEEVSRFLESNSYLGPILIEAYEKIQDYFGPRPDVALEVVRDPEVRGLIQLVGYIVTDITPEEAGRRLQQFDRGWLLHEIHRARGVLNFDVEFV